MTFLWYPSIPGEAYPTGAMRLLQMLSAGGATV